MHYLIVSLVSSVYNFAFTLGVVALINLALYLRIALSPNYSVEITKPELLGMALSLPALGILINVLQSIEKHKRAKVASELAFLRYAMEDLDSKQFKSEELRIQRGVDIVYEVNRTIKNVLFLMRNSLKANSCAFVQISGDYETGIIRAYDSVNKGFKKDYNILLTNNIYRFAISKQSAYQKQSETPLNMQLDLYDSDSQPVSSVLVIPIIESTAVVALVIVDSTDKRIFNVDEIELAKRYADFILEQICIYKMLKESEEKANQFQMLSIITGDLMQSLKLNAILESLINYCQKSAAYDAVLLVLRNNNILDLMIQKGFDNAKKRLRIDQCKNWVGWFLLNRDEPLLLNDIHTDKMPLWDNSEKIKFWKAIYFVPLIRKSIVSGVILFAAERRDIFKTHIRTMLAIIANHASVIIENAMLYEKTEFMAITDGLTEVPNHRCFQETLTNYLEKAKQEREQISLVIVDIDFLFALTDLLNL